MREQIIETRLRDLLKRLSPPMRVKGSAELQAQEVKALFDAISARAPRSDVEDWMRRWEEMLLRSHSTRAWPILKEVHDAADRLQRDAAPGEANISVDADYAAAWIQRTGRVPGWLNSVELTAELLRRGVVSDLREARFRGCEMTREQDEAARKMKMGRDERDHHLKVMARLWNCSIAEAAARLSKEAAA